MIIFLMMFIACTLKSVNLTPDVYLTSVSAGGSAGEFYVSSNVMCGTNFLTSRITLCKYSDREKETVCVNVADTDSIGLSVAANGTSKFKVSSKEITCVHKYYDVNLKNVSSKDETFIDY